MISAPRSSADVEPNLVREPLRESSAALQNWRAIRIPPTWSLAHFATGEHRHSRLFRQNRFPFSVQPLLGPRVYSEWALIRLDSQKTLNQLSMKRERSSFARPTQTFRQ